MTTFTIDDYVSAVRALREQAPSPDQLRLNVCGTYGNDDPHVTAVDCDTNEPRADRLATVALIMHLGGLADVLYACIDTLYVNIGGAYFVDTSFVDGAGLRGTSVTSMAERVLLCCRVQHNMPTLFVMLPYSIDETGAVAWREMNSDEGTAFGVIEKIVDEAVARGIEARGEARIEATAVFSDEVIDDDTWRAATRMSAIDVLRCHDFVLITAG